MNQRVLLVALLALSACGSKKEEGAAGPAASASKLVASCDQRTTTGALKTCLEYMGSAWTAKEVKARCSMEGQVFLETACPAEGIVYSCVQEGGKPMEANVRYYGDLEKAKKVCADVGKPLP